MLPRVIAVVVVPLKALVNVATSVADAVLPRESVAQRSFHRKGAARWKICASVRAREAPSFRIEAPGGDFREVP